MTCASHGRDTPRCAIMQAGAAPQHPRARKMPLFRLELCLEAVVAAAPLPTRMVVSLHRSKGYHVNWVYERYGDRMHIMLPFRLALCLGALRLRCRPQQRPPRFGRKVSVAPWCRPDERYGDRVRITPPFRLALCLGPLRLPLGGELPGEETFVQQRYLEPGGPGSLRVSRVGRFGDKKVAGSTFVHIKL